MIKLIDILKEANADNTPQAIFLAGPAGSGKSFVSKLLPLSKFNIINVDDTYEQLLQASGIGMNQKNFNPDELKKSAELMYQARQTTQGKYEASLSDLHDILIDGTAASTRETLKKKQQLEDLGYKTMMIMIWVSPITSLKANMKRERSLMPSIVLKTWKSVNQNIDAYKQAFGDNFIIINNNPKDAETQYDAEDIKARFFDTAKYYGKEKSPEEKEKSKAAHEQLNQEISQLAKIKPDFTSIPDAKSKIQAFIK